MVDPILIMACPRSGSSMTAGLFHIHGVWVGSHQPGDKWNPKGHFEGFAVKYLIKRWHNAIVHKGVLAQQIPGFRDEVEKAVLHDGYEAGPWLWKGSVLYWPAFFEFDPTWIVVRRDINATVKSCDLSGMLRGPRVREIIEMHHREMDRLVEMGAAEVRTDELIAGDYSSLESALAHCGIKISPEKVKEFINPGHWHYGPDIT